MIEGPKIVLCRWCPSAPCAEHDLRRARKSAGAAVGTTDTARASLSCSSNASFVSSRHASFVWRDGSLVRSALPVYRVCGSGFDVKRVRRRSFSGAEADRQASLSPEKSGFFDFSQDTAAWIHSTLHHGATRWETKESGLGRPS